MDNHFSCPVTSNISQLFLYIIAHLSGEVDTIHARLAHPINWDGGWVVSNPDYPHLSVYVPCIQHISRAGWTGRRARWGRCCTPHGQEWEELCGILLLPLQMMTAVEETGGCVPLSELVTGATTRRCCQWVSPHTTHISTSTIHCGGEVGYTTTHCGGWGGYTTTTHCRLLL